jgi:hypothetical protein
VNRILHLGCILAHVFIYIYLPCRPQAASSARAELAAARKRRGPRMAARWRLAHGEARTAPGEAHTEGARHARRRRGRGCPTARRA